jgi:hypothetical protein
MTISKMEKRNKVDDGINKKLSCDEKMWKR